MILMVAGLGLGLGLGLELQFKVERLPTQTEQKQQNENGFLPLSNCKTFCARVAMVRPPFGDFREAGAGPLVWRAREESSISFDSVEKP